MPLISIVVPVFNEEDNIENFHREVSCVCAPLMHEIEMIFVDDGSSDATPLLLEKLSRCDSRVSALILARNFGQQIALTCGLDHASGDAVITMDGDMQHPPELIPALIKQWENGFEVVQTIRKDTEGVSRLKKSTSAIFYKMINAMSKVRVQEGGSDFRLMDKRVVESFRRFRERARFIRGMVGAIGYRQIQVEFVAPKRFAGKSKFSFKKMLHFALDGITAYSKLPLRVAFYIGLLFSFLSFALTMHLVYIKIFTEEAVPGWTTASVSISLLGGIQLLGLGIIGEYVGRIFEEVKQRPLYWIRNEYKNREKIK